MAKQKQATVAPTKSVTILARYRIKATGSVVCQVRNDAGHEYIVTLNKNGSAGCTCEANSIYHRGCYHIKHCRQVEAASTVAQGGKEEARGAGGQAQREAGRVSILQAMKEARGLVKIA